jgi:hypothetical protein
MPSSIMQLWGSWKPADGHEVNRTFSTVSIDAVARPDADPQIIDRSFTFAGPAHIPLSKIPRSA